MADGSSSIACSHVDRNNFWFWYATLWMLVALTALIKSSAFFTPRAESHTRVGRSHQPRAMADQGWWNDTRPWRFADDFDDGGANDWNPGEWNATPGGAIRRNVALGVLDTGGFGRLADAHGNVWEVNITDVELQPNNDFLTDDDRRRIERAEPDAETEPVGRRSTNQVRSRISSEAMQQRMRRALEMADRMGDTHGHLLTTGENSAERSRRIRNRERTGYDWITDRENAVREHFFATYLAMGGGTSRGLLHERRPRPLEPMEVETSPSVCNHLERSFQLAVRLASIEQNEDEEARRQETMEQERRDRMTRLEREARSQSDQGRARRRRQREQEPEAERDVDPWWRDRDEELRRQELERRYEQDRSRLERMRETRRKESERRWMTCVMATRPTTSGATTGPTDQGRKRPRR